MVTGLELLAIGIGTNVFSFILKQILKKATNHSESKNRVNFILTDMKPLIEGLKKPDGEAGVPEYLKQLIQKVDEGNIILQKEEKKEKLDQWIELLRHLLPRALLKVFIGIAENKVNLTQLLNSNQENQSIPLHLQFKEDEHKKKFREFIDCANIASEPLLQEKMKQSNPQASKGVAKSGQFPENVDNPTEPVLRKVVFGVLARDGHAKEMVEQAARECKVKGVLYTELEIKHNESQDLVTVIGTEIFDEEEMTKYLEDTLTRKNVAIKEKQILR